jgi:hypothetical protein
MNVAAGVALHFVLELVVAVVQEAVLGPSHAPRAPRASAFHRHQMPLTPGDNVWQQIPGAVPVQSLNEITFLAAVSSMAFADSPSEPSLGAAFTNGVDRELLPGEHRLLELIDGVVAALQTQPAQLQQHRTGRCVDEVVSQRDLHDRAWALGDGDEPGRIVAQ